MKRTFTLLVLLSLGVSFLRPSSAYSQLASCSPLVPYHYVDLTGQPEGTWISPSHSRKGNCCGTVSPDRCTSFEILLDSNATGLVFEIISGAIPTGSMFYQIDCGTQTPVGNLICLNGVGPHRLTFCKPGNNQNQYRIRSVAKPIVQDDDSTRFGCSLPLSTIGFNPSTITWTSIYPGSTGQYNNTLNCTSGCANVIFTPPTNSIPYYDFRVCGTPVATQCGYTQFCDTIRVYVKDSLGANFNPNPAKYCDLGAGSGVNITANAYGGGQNYTYQWTNSSNMQVSTSASYFASAQEQLSVKIDDEYSSSLCPSKYLTVPVVAVSPPSVDAGLGDSLCQNDADHILMGSGSNFSSLIWSGGLNTYTPNNQSLNVQYNPSAAELTQGFVTHYLTAVASDPACPNALDSVTVQFVDSIQINLSNQMVDCFGDSALISPVVTGGAGAYQYSWNSGESSASINVPAGQYCLAVTDNGYCTSTACTTISEPAALGANMSSTDVTINGGSDGTATAAPFGGTPPYSYLWSPSGNTSATDTNLPKGLYSCLITDANGCSYVAYVAVIEPACLNFDVNVLTDSVSCHEGSDGWAYAQISFGTPPFTYLWDDGLMQTTDTAFNLSAGTYQVQVEDANNCFAASYGVVEQPNSLQISFTVNDVSTVGGSDGQISSSVSGGTPPYTYNWSNGATTSNISGLSTAWYSIEVTDANGCVLIDSVFVRDPDCSTLAVSLIGTNLSCYQDNSGQIEAFAVGGNGAYTYFWDGTIGANITSGLTAGLHTLFLFDQALCAVSDSLTILQPDELMISGTSTSTSCIDSLDGSIDILVAGGTYPYTYLWSDSTTNEDLINVAAGTYILTVNDINGCMAQFAGTINQPDTIQLSYSIQDNKCFGIPTAYIDLTVTGGLMPYSYAWSDGSTTEDLVNILGGLYYVEVTDANGCSQGELAPVYVGQADSIEITLTALVYENGYNVSANGKTDGEIEVTVLGGLSPYNYEWSNGSTDSVITALGIGSYTVIVTDANGCENEKTQIITGPSVLQFPTVVTANGDGSNDLFVILGLEQYPINAIQIFNRWGNEVYQMDNYDNSWGGVNQENEALPEGYYFYVFTAEEIEAVNGFIEIKR